MFDWSIKTKLFLIILVLVVLLTFMFRNWKKYMAVEKAMYSVMVLILVIQIFLGSILNVLY